MCPIALVLIHVLRHGLVLGSTIEQVLENAANASDAKVVLLFPDRPLFAEFSRKSIAECEFDKPAGNYQVLQTNQTDGYRIQPALSSLRSRATPRCSACLRPAKDGSGFTTNEVPQSLGHSHSAFERGTTEKYVGDSRVLQ
ncbi:hypothetical protein V1506DRAFT_90447 [Lipomyces tetrasporus]